MAKKSKKHKHRLTKKTADKHRLYQKSVQDPDFEVELVSKLFKRRVGRKAMSLREDFCGTAFLCSRWVESHRKRTATGVDNHSPTLRWGREHNIAPLGKHADRVTLIEGDVRDRHPVRHDVVMALNYSYFCFKERDVLRGYFEAVKEHLVPDGLFFMDLFGGWEAQQVMEEERKLRHFRYVWDQRKYNPITAELIAHIHFKFADGSKMKKAFTYDWRLWTISELRELLAEAGFGRVECLWEDEDEDGEGNGNFRRRVDVENDPAWNAYLMASVGEPEKRRKNTPPG